MRLNIGFLLHENVGYSRNFSFEEPDLTLGDDLLLSTFHGDLNLTRTAQGVYAHGDFTADAEVECVRCLTHFLYPLHAKLDEMFTLPAHGEADPSLIIPENGMLDFNPLLREVFLLDIPMRPLCHTDCKGICPICGANQNETECHHAEETIDPRMEVLKALLPKT